MGSSAGALAWIDDTVIDGDVRVEEGGALRGNLQMFKNTGSVTLVDNRIEQTLQCGENEPAPTGNLAGEKEGRCSEI